MRVRPRQGESWEAFRKRRTTATRKVADATGSWSNDWKSALLSWHGHVQRANDPGAWNKAAFEHKGQMWLLEQRLSNSTGGSFNRTRTRNVRGPPAKRWFEGIEEVQPALAMPRPKVTSWAKVIESVCNDL